MNPKWLEWSRRLQALAQTGLAYAQTPFDRERYEAVRRVAEEIMAGHSSLEPDQVRALFTVDSGYATPKVDVRGAILREDKILLVHESIDNRWAMPGGWADVGLSIRDNIKKEAKEEAGMIVDPYKLVGVFDWTKNVRKPFPYSIYKTVMLCRPEEWDFHKNIETLGADFFSRDRLPELSSGRTTESLINLCFEARENKNYVPIVD